MSAVQSTGMPINGCVPINEAGFDSQKLRLRGDNVLVLLDMHRDARNEDRQTESGIYIPRTVGPTSAKEAVWGTVVRAAEKTELAAGERVLLENPLVGDQILIDGTEHRLVRMGVVMAVGE